tara:strand:+ start:10159 stop:12750 length:2592 start_codon:yes stop_codon:yes gene_type:complete
MYLAYLTPGLKGSIDQELRIFFKQTDRIISKSIKDSMINIYSSIKFKNFNEIKYDKLKIDISFKNFEILQKERKKALIDGINESRKKIPIRILYKNREYRGTARLKGVLTDHYGNNKQFSLRVKLRDGKSIKGMREFSLTQHFARQYPQNIIYSSILSEAGIAAPNFFTFKINLNGDDWGLMLAEEQYSDAYFELRKKKYSPVIKFTNEENSYLFRILLKDFEKKKIYKEIDFVNFKHGKIENSTYNKKEFNNFYFENFFNYIKGIKFAILRNEIPLDEYEKIFDMDKFSKIIILSLVTGEYHPLGYRNIRFYFNPFNQKLEPIPTDWGETFIRELKDIDQLENELFNLINCEAMCSRQDYPLYDRILKSDLFMERFKINLKNFENYIGNVKNNLETLCEYQGKQCYKKFDYSTFEKNLEVLKNSIDFKRLFQKKYFVSKNFDLTINEELKEKYLTNLKNPIFARALNNGNIKVMNLTPFKLDIKNIFLIKKNCKKNCSIKIDKRVSIPVSDFEFSKIILKKDLSDYGFVSFEVYGGLKKLNSPKFIIENQKYDNLEKQKIYNLDNFKISENEIIVKEGVYSIENPIYVPKNFNLKVLPGAKMFFKKNSFINVEGGNIEAVGNKNNKIYFQASSSKDGWKGILVKNSFKKSIFENVVFTDLNYFNSFKTHLTGSINFYKANVDILDTEFTNSRAEDFLNITHSKFTITNAKFTDCLSDAFDSDFSSGVIKNSEFNNIKGDAVDFSGSQVSIINSKFNTVEDKGISAGESSNIVSDNNSFINSGIGIASKDRSTVEAINNNFLNSKLYDLIAFNKKDFYEKGGKINFKTIDKNINLKIKSDLTSKIFINKKKIKNEKINLNEIY